MNPVLAAGATNPRPRSGWPPYASAVIALLIAALVMFTLRTLLFGGGKALPGTDAGVYYAWEIYTRLAFASWRLPHWNPYLFTGTPHLADTETFVLYPIAMALRWIPALPFMSWMLGVHMWIAGMGSAYLARQLALRWEAAAAAAVAAALGGSMPAWVHNGHVTLLFTAAWLPWVFALMIVSARRRTVWPHPALVVVLVVQFLAGYLQGNIYIVLAAALFALWGLIWPPPQMFGDAPSKTRPLAQFVIAGVLACGLAAFQLFPTLLAVGAAGRTQGLPADMAMRWSWTLPDLVRFFTPFAGIDSPAPMRYLADQTVYVGWVLVLLAPVALIGRAHRSVAAFFTMLAVLAMAFAFGDALPFYSLHYWLFPGLRIPGRLLILVTFSVSMLGAIGIDRLATLLAPERWRRVRTTAVLLILALVTADLTIYASGAVNVVNAGRLPAVAFERPPGIGRTLTVCESALSAADMVPAGRPSFTGMGSVFLRDYDSFLTVAAEEGPLRLRRDLLDHVNITSVISCTPLESPGLQLIYQSGDVRVYRNDTAWPRAVWGCGGEQVTTTELADLLRYVGYSTERQIDRAPIVNVRWAASLADDARLALERRYHLDSATWREGTTWRYALKDWSPQNVQALLSDASITDTHGIDRIAGQVSGIPDTGERQMLFGSVSCDYQAPVDVTAADQLNGDVSATIDAPVNGVLFLSELSYPERVAYVDGQRVTTLKANLAFTAVPVAAGRHRVELRYEAVTFWRGLGVSAVTLIAWIVARGRRRARSAD
jgi:hypothetical protein